MVKENRSILLYFQYILLFFLIYWVSVSCSKEETLDLYRSYYEAEFNAEHYSLIEMIGLRLSYQIDFLYYVILCWAIKASIPLNWVTTGIVFLYYILIVKSVKIICRVRATNIVLLILLFTTPMIWVVSISRNLTAFMFLFIAITCYCKKHKILSLVFIVAAVLTHFTVVLYIFVMFSSLLLNNTKVSSSRLALLFLGTILVGLFAPTLIQDILFRFTNNQEISYSVYAEALSRIYLYNESTNYADKIPMTFAFFYSIVLLRLNRKQGAAFWGLLILTLLMLLFMCSMYTLIHRCMMMMPIFWGFNVGSILSTGTKRDRTNLEIVSIIGVFAILLQVFGCRHIYFSSL